MPESEKRKAAARAYKLAHKEEIRLQRQDYHKRRRAERNAYCTAYNAAHREEQRAATAAWREANPTASKEYHDTHKEEEKAYAATYQATHRAERSAYRVRRNAENPGPHRAAQKKRRAAKANAPVNDFTPAQWKEMQEHYGHRCVYCNKRAKGHLTQDHLTPLSQGGSHTKGNILPACHSCNSKKQAGAVLKPVQPLLI